MWWTSNLAPYPTSVCTFGCRSLENNQLTASIPNSLGNLTSLQNLWAPLCVKNWRVSLTRHVWSSFGEALWMLWNQNFAIKIANIIAVGRRYRSIKRWCFPVCMRTRPCFLRRVLICCKKPRTNRRLIEHSFWSIGFVTVLGVVSWMWGFHVKDLFVSGIVLCVCRFAGWLTTTHWVAPSRRAWGSWRTFNSCESHGVNKRSHLPNKGGSRF